MIVMGIVTKIIGTKIVSVNQVLTTISVKNKVVRIKQNAIQTQPSTFSPHGAIALRVLFQ